MTKQHVEALRDAHGQTTAMTIVAVAGQTNGTIFLNGLVDLVMDDLEDEYG